jgi:hypothetical protein
MPYKAVAKTIIDAVEYRVKLNIAKGNFAPIVLTISEAELKTQMGLERLKTVTRKRLVASLAAADYIVTDEGDGLLIEVDVAGRDTQFDSLAALIESTQPVGEPFRG